MMTHVEWSRVALFAVAIPLVGCMWKLQRTVHQPEAPPAQEKRDAVLKAHLKSGELIVFESWVVDGGQRSVSGTGIRYGLGRERGVPGFIRIELHEVALFEANRPVTSSAIAPFVLVTAGTTITAAYCFANPKTCFGSCPTFYVPGDDGELLAAEAFSDAVAPALARTDIDSLYRMRIVSRSLDLRVTNEALETHVIERADLLAAPRPPDGRVVATPSGELFATGGFEAPSGCVSDGKDCLAAVSLLDDHEYWSPTDEHDLAARHVIELTFPTRIDDGPWGLVIEARQTFVTTFVMYQTLAYLGTRAGAVLASLANAGPNAEREGLVGLARLFELLGGIDVVIDGQGQGQGRTQGAFFETGPIARDLQLVPMAAGVRSDRVELRMARGMYRLGFVGRVRLGPRVQNVVRLRPIRIEAIRGDARAAQAFSAGSASRLTTFPGDAYRLHYELPDRPESFDYFLEGHGYYLEWMRSEWLQEENFSEALFLAAFPAQALRKLAPEFKRLEADFEAAFWSSRFVPVRAGR